MRTRMIAGLLALVCLPLQAQLPLQQTIDRAAAREPLAGAVVGAMVQDMSGHIVASRESGRRMVPASNLKIITTGSALHSLGPDFRFETGIGYTGTVEEGTLNGDVYIIGGGDPTIGVNDTVAVKPDALFLRWKNLLKEAGINRIDGRIIGDGRAYEGHLENITWGFDDTGTFYGAGCSALSFYKNAIEYAISAGKEGEPVNVVQRYPDTPWIHFSNLAVTGPAGSGNSLYLFTTDLVPYAELRGTFATDRWPKTERYANKFGALTCAYYFWKDLQESGWEVTGGYADIDRGGYIRGADFVAAEKAGTPTLIGVSRSVPLSKITRATLLPSDNFYAEAIFRQMGERASGIALYDSCRVAVKNVLAQLLANRRGAPGDLSGLRQVDGSGLSRLNTISPAFMVSFLRAMTRSSSFDAFLASFAKPGEGTLSNILTQLTPEQKECIRMKSGSMDGIVCYSGYILDKEGKPTRAFSLMVNGATAPIPTIRTTLSSLVEAML